MTAHRSKATQGRSAIVVLVLSLLSATSLRAQVAVFPVQNLSFGTIRAGAPEYVAPDDVGRRAELELVGSGTVVVTFALPAEMVSGGGHRLPLQFDKSDGTFVYRGGSSERSFDPNKSANFHLKAGDGGGTLCLGGLALPDASQPPGRYNATITVQVVAPGT